MCRTIHTFLGGLTIDTRLTMHKINWRREASWANVDNIWHLVWTKELFISISAVESLFSASNYFLFYTRWCMTNNNLLKWNKRMRLIKCMLKIIRGILSSGGVVILLLLWMKIDAFKKFVFEGKRKGKKRCVPTLSPFVSNTLLIKGPYSAFGMLKLNA